MTSLMPVLVSHLLADLVVKTEKMRTRKALLTDWGTYGRHGFLVFGLMWAALAWQLGGSWRVALCALAIALAHLAVDCGKYVALRLRPRLQRALAWLLFDCHELIAELLILLAAQGLHLIAIDLLTGLFFPPLYPLSTVGWYVNAHLAGTARIAGGDRLFYLLALYSLGTLGGARVIQFVERAFYPGELQDVTHKEVWETTSKPAPGSGAVDVVHRHVETAERSPSPIGKPGTSYWVGILERLAIMLWPLIPGLGLVVTAALGAKSIARYNQFKHKAFVEYFIVGTLASIVWGAVFAWFVYRALPQS